MAAKKQVLSNFLLDAVLRNVAYASPAAVYAALFTVVPTATDAGTEVSAVGTGYSRLPVTFSAPLNAGCSNTNAVTWAAATGGGYETVVAVAICASATVGTPDYLYFGPLDVPTAIADTDEANFAVGVLQVIEG